MDSNRPTLTSEAARGAVQQGRRRLFAGAATGVLLAVPARTALGGDARLCQTPSVMMSVGPSQSPGFSEGCSGGRSPGYWVQPQHAPSWTKAGAIFPTFKDPVATCSTGVSDLTSATIDNPGTLLGSVFPGMPNDKSLWEPLALAPKTYSQLQRHLVAAWLNAGFFAGDYPLTQAQVVDMWVQLNTTGFYCWYGTGNCGTLAWTADQVKSYIENMYDINSDSAVNLCKKKP